MSHATISILVQGIQYVIHIHTLSECNYKITWIIFTVAVNFGAATTLCNLIKCNLDVIFFFNVTLIGRKLSALKTLLYLCYYLIARCERVIFIKVYQGFCKCSLENTVSKWIFKNWIKKKMIIGSYVEMLSLRSRKRFSVLAHILLKKKKREPFLRLV